ncbi:putative non-specific serine/threonine protein kinase [Helianthus anomalus]
MDVYHCKGVLSVVNSDELHTIQVVVREIYEIVLACKWRIGEKQTNKIVFIGISEGVAGAALTIIFVLWEVKHRRKIEVRKDFFKQNGGIMLHKMLFTHKDSANQATIFTKEELKKATSNFNDANVIGQGGYGTVYKGYLTNK